jgi:putative nucleotidyltransferase with HDIG domain
VTQHSAVDRDAFRDTAQGDVTRLRSMAHVVSPFARPYVITVFCAGCAVLALSTWELWTMQLPVQWWALIAVTLISGSAVLKIPGIAVNFSISDVFTLTSAVVFGPAAGTVMVAIDSLAISARLSRKGLPLERVLFNAAAPPAAMWLSARTFFHWSGIQPLNAQNLGLDVVGPWLLVFAGLYFFLNTFAIAVAVALNERRSAVAIWRSHFQNLWFTFIGGALGAAFVVFALQLGTYGLVLLSLPVLLAVILHFAYRNATGRVEDRLRHLEDVNRLHLSTIEALAHAIDAKDGVTHDHIRRVQSRAVALAARLEVNDPQQIRAIEAAALLHDVGKIAIPEHILNKPGKLTPAEFERMKSHVRVGAEILSAVDFPYPVIPIVLHHHENWDGTGYPDGLRGTDIPIGARILSVVDCFDALTSDRPYRRALSVRETFEIIDARTGSMYDPAVVSAFHDMCEMADVSSDTGEEAGLEAPAPAIESSRSDTAERPAMCDDIHIAVQLGAAISHASEEVCPWGVLADALCEQPDVDTVVLFVVNDANDQLVPYRVSGKYSWNLKHLAIMMGERMSGWVAAVGQPMLNGDAALDLFDMAPHSLRSAAAIPVPGPGGARAVVTLYSTRSDVFLPVHKRLVEEGSAVVAYQETTMRARAEIIDRPGKAAAQSRLRAVPSESSSSPPDTSRPHLRPLSRNIS